MFFLAIFTLICVVFLFIDIKPLFRNRQWVQLGVYLAMMLLAYVIVVLVSLDVKVPSPAVPLKNVTDLVTGQQED